MDPYSMTYAFIAQGPPPTSKGAGFLRGKRQHSAGFVISQSSFGNGYSCQAVLTGFWLKSLEGTEAERDLSGLVG